MVTIYVPGTFDMWNIGHIRLLKYAKSLFPETTVISGVSTNKLVKSYKIINPVNTLAERVETVKACRYVDKVIVQGKFFDPKQLRKYNIDYVLLGSDWKGVDFPALTYAQGILKFNVIYKPYTKEVSSSIIKERIIKNAYDIIKAQTQRGSK